MNKETETGSAAAQTSPTDSPSAEGTLSQVGEQARQAGAQAAAAAASDVAHDAQTRVASLAGEVKDRVASAAQGSKEEVAEGLDDVAKAMRRSGEQLEGHQDWIAHLVERGADELGALAATLRTNDLQGLLGKLEDLARRQPAVFVGAAMAAGFATVRLGKVAVSGVSRADLPNMPEVVREPNEA